MRPNLDKFKLPKVFRKGGRKEKLKRLFIEKNSIETRLREIHSEISKLRAETSGKPVVKIAAEPDRSLKDQLGELYDNLLTFGEEVFNKKNKTKVFTA